MESILCTADELDLMKELHKNPDKFLKDAKYSMEEVKRRNELTLLIYHVLRNTLDIPHDCIVSLNITFGEEYSLISLPILVNNFSKWKEVILLNTLTNEQVKEELVNKFKDCEFPNYKVLYSPDELEETFFSESPIKKHTVKLLKDSEGLNYVKIDDKITLLKSNEYTVTQWGNQEYIIKGFSSVTTYLDNPSTQVKLICKI